MKRVNTFGKRAIALLLVVFMLVGQLPVGVVAEGPEGENPPAAVPETGKEFKLVVTRTAVPAPAAEGEEPAPGEGEGEGEGEEEQIPTYTYNAVVYYDGIQLTGDQLTESTHYWGTENVVPADDGASLTTEATEMKYTVQYRGRELSADIAQDGTVEKVWSASCGVISAVAGVPYDFSGVKPVADAENGSSVLTDGTWEFAADSSVIDANNIPTKAGEGLSAGQYLLKFEDTVEYVVPVTANISILTPADPTVAVSGEGYADGAWYTGAGPLTAAVTFNYSAKVESQYLPKLNLNGTPVEVTWAEPVQSEGEPAIFSYEGTYEMTKLTNAKHTLTFGDASCTVLVDNAAPSFVASGYKQGNGAVISVSNIESVSGIKEWTPADPVDGKILIENYDPEKGIVIGATAYNGLYYEVSPEIDDYVYANWSHTFTADDIVPTADGKVWLKKGVTGTVTVSLENPGDLISSGVQLSNGAVLNAENNYTQTVTITDDAEPITISGADKYGREILWAAAPVAYRYDKEAPVVNFVDTTAEPNVVGDVKYYNAPVEYKITISDNLEMGTASVQADGININGNNGVYTITVNNGEKLEKIEVAATDASGNTATETYEIKAVVDTDKPVVTIELSENIEKLLTVNEDAYIIDSH